MKTSSLGKRKKKRKIFPGGKNYKMCKYAQKYFFLTRCSVCESMSISAKYILKNTE